jgi:hypothetical protein
MSKTHSSTLVRAAALAACAAADRVFVFSSSDAALLAAENASATISKLPFSTVHCADCTTEFATPRELASAELHCIVCGSTHVKEKATAADDDGMVDFPVDEECVSVDCASCGTTHALQRSVLAALDKEISCTICGTKITAADDEGMDDEEFDADEIASDDLEEVDLLGDDSAGEGDAAPVADPVGNPGDLTAAGDEGSESEGGDPESDGGAVASDEAEELEVSLMDDLEDVPAEASVLDFGDSIAIACKTTIVAHLHQSAAGDNKDLWGKDAFHTAIANHLKQHGVVKTVEAFSFSPVKIKIRVAKQLATVVSAKVESATAELLTKEKQLEAAVKQSLDIATVGINKGFWKGITNPLKAALVAELTTAGVQSPAKIVDRVFDKHGLAYAATLLQQAQVVRSRSAESRNELAATLDLVNTVLSAEEDEDDSIDDSDEFAATAHIRPVAQSETAALLGGKAGSPSRPTSVIASLLKSHGKDASSSLFPA